MQMLFFDLDGTLTDPAPGIVACLRHAIRALGHTGRLDHDLTRFIGPPLRDAFREILQTNDDTLLDRAIAKYRERFATEGLFENAVYPGIVEVLAALDAAGFELRVVTSKPKVYADRIVDHFGLRPFFPVVYGAELSGQRSHKAELIAFVLESEVQDARHACMIGDRRHDIDGARAHGMTAAGVLWGYGARAELEAAGAHCLVERVADLPTVLGALRAASRSDRGARGPRE